MVISPLKVDEMIVTVEEMLDAERFLIDFDAKQLDKATKIRLGQSRLLVYRVSALALLVAAAAWLAEVVGKGIDTMTDTAPDPDPPRRRRKVRLQLCVVSLVRILDSAAEDVKGGFYLDNALQTERSAKRTVRKFESRA